MMNGKTKTIAGGAVVVVVSAVIILAGISLSSPKKPSTPPTIQLSPQQQSQRAYDQGLAALQSGDTTKAVTALTRSVQLDPNNSAAKAKLAEVTRAQNSSSGSTAPGSSKPTDPPAATTPDPFLKRIGNLKTLLPATFAGFTMGIATGDKSSSTVPASPSSSNGSAHILWSAYDRGSASDAAKFIVGVSKSLYTHDGSGVTVGDVKGYFGTDGQRLASVSFTRGRFVFEVVLTSSSGSPGLLKGQALQAAAAFPAKP